ncbi:MAG: twin-arginine translocase TatA/TatE family subunit [Anaerolineales bacterium]
MFGIQPIHILIIIVVALLIFGPRRLPEMGRSIGKAFSEFRRGTKEMTDAFQEGAGLPGNAGASNTIAPPPGTPLSAPGTSLPASSPSVAPSPAGNFCINCGAPNAPEANFCNQCGTKLPAKAL